MFAIKSLTLLAQSEISFSNDTLSSSSINNLSENILSLYVETDSTFFPLSDTSFQIVEKKNISVSKDAIDQKVTYTATGYIKNDLKNKRAILVGSA